MIYFGDLLGRVGRRDAGRTGEHIEQSAGDPANRHSGECAAGIGQVLRYAKVILKPVRQPKPNESAHGGRDQSSVHFIPSAGQIGKFSGNLAKSLATLREGKTP